MRSLLKSTCGNWKGKRANSESGPFGKLNLYKEGRFLGLYLLLGQSSCFISSLQLICLRTLSSAKMNVKVKSSGKNKTSYDTDYHILLTFDFKQPLCSVLLVLKGWRGRIHANHFTQIEFCLSLSLT